ncbi:MAG: CoA transferase [Chloroflexota bacterium]|nr:MAG: CoA transferase [Chloroflexota bacterium]
MPKPLAGVRVLDLTRLIPGGVCTMMLADLGADVIKIEDPNGGDYGRWMPPLVDGLSVFFRICNRNKRSAILDLKTPDGLAALRRLVKGADVLVEGFRPDVMRRLGCDYESLRAVNPRLVYASISGWGSDGLYAARSGHDLNYTAVAGLVGAMKTPQVIGGQTADIGGAYVAVAGIAAGLFQAQRTGEGCHVEASLFEAALPFVLYPWAEALKTGVGGGQGALTGGAACYNVYHARDGRAVSLSALEPKFWANFCHAVERADLIADHLLPERQAYLRAELAELFALKTAAEWDERLRDADCCFAVINAPGEVANDPHIQARGAMGIGADGTPWMRSPLRLEGEAFEPGRVPGYGEHTRIILAEAGYAAGEIEALIAIGAARAG